MSYQYAPFKALNPIMFKTYSNDPAQTSHQINHSQTSHQINYSQTIHQTNHSIAKIDWSIADSSLLLITNI